LPEGSPSSFPPPEKQALRDAITVSSKPKQPAPPTPVPLTPGSLHDIEAPLGGDVATPSSSVDDKLIALRAKLPAGLQTKLEKVPTRVLFGVGGALALLLVIGLLSAIASAFSGSDSGGTSPGPSATASGEAPSAPPTPAKEGPFARPDELNDAKSGGAKAFEALAEKYPRDPNIPVEIARDLAAKKNWPGAVGAVGRALSIDANFQNNAQVASLVFQTAQVKVSSDAAFALLEGAMGSRGADIAYDLVTTSNVRPWVQTRAESFLQSPAFDKVATPNLRAIVKLRYSAGCEEKRALLPDLKTHADERALFELVPLQDKTGCGARKKDDCYPCLRTTNDLDDTIAAVRTRKR
jgi:hypothetical protein